MTKTGLLLINLGTPDNCDTKSVRRYLREFLNDPYVIDLPWFIRQILLNLVILPTRPKQSAHAYQSIWTKQGSPLLIHSQNLADKVQQQIGDNIQVTLGMRYGKPSIESALSQLKECDKIIVLPLFPQFSQAATTSALVKTREVAQKHGIAQKLVEIQDFYQQEDFISAQAEIIKPYLNNQDDFILFSYHGLPERHLNKLGCQTICQGVCRVHDNTPTNCYRRQSFQTSRLLAKELQLDKSQYITAFQSRLGKTPWIQPYTDKVIEQLAQKGIKNLIIACPSFVADCLETLEEIGIQAKAQWHALGGQDFKLVPCLNDDDNWVKAVIKIALAEH